MQLLRLLRQLNSGLCIAGMTLWVGCVWPGSHQYTHWHGWLSLPLGRLVEGIISGLQSEAASEAEAAGLTQLDTEADGGTWTSLDAPQATATAAGGQQQLTAALVEELTLLGFLQNDAAAAVATLGGGGGGVDGLCLSDALDWLCVRLPEERLPKNFAPGEPVSFFCSREGSGLARQFIVAALR